MKRWLHMLDFAGKNGAKVDPNRQRPKPSPPRTVPMYIEGYKVYTYEFDYDCKAYLHLTPPVSEKYVMEVEAKLGVKLPTSFRSIVTQFASKFSFSWSLPHDCPITKEERDFYLQSNGHCEWNLDGIAVRDFDEMADVFRSPDISDEEMGDFIGSGKVKLHFDWGGDGTQLIMDCFEGAEAKVLCIDHEYERLIELGDSFADYLDRITAIGCVGLEHFTLEGFSTDRKLDINCTKALDHRRVFGLEGL